MSFGHLIPCTANDGKWLGDIPTHTHHIHTHQLAFALLHRLFSLDFNDNRALGFIKQYLYNPPNVYPFSFLVFFHGKIVLNPAEKSVTHLSTSSVTFWDIVNGMIYPGDIPEVRAGGGGRVTRTPRVSKLSVVELSWKKYSGLLLKSSRGW